jgi:hypothetical protein
MQSSSTLEHIDNPFGHIDYQLGVEKNGDAVNIILSGFDFARAYINTTEFVKPQYSPPPYIPSIPSNIVEPNVPPPLPSPWKSATTPPESNYPLQVFFLEVSIAAGFIAVMVITLRKRKR